MSIPPDPTSLTFQQANDHQLNLIWALNATAWAPPLSPAAHIVRERWLSEQPLTGHKWRTFVLFRHEDEIIASCEVFEKEIVVYYEKLGWTPYSTRQLVLESTTELSDMGDLADVYPLGDEQMEDLCREDIHALEKEFSQPPGDSDHHIHIAFTPTAHQIQWHLARQDHMENALFAREKSTCRGAMAKSKRAWLIWYLDHAEKKCKIQRIVLLDKHERERNASEVAALLFFALREARAQGIGEVVVWNPCGEVEGAGRLLGEKFEGVGVKMEERDSSIPALRRWNGEATGDVVWKYNEYYAWC
ncbi:hypothetical protein EG328_008186 [Venturia inaequalis]|uniref:LYC1 C-terminal domain-containing protein n=1 Tax=Venturia inaequalis TaxID=5025 RepID=A0A8H3UEX0_VENIN|nr:hypothetical protein EG328_008186 [Venturia inaequalis]